MAEHDPGRTATPAITTTPPARWRLRGLGLVAALVMTAGLLSACDSSPVVLSGDVTYAAPAVAARTTDAVVDTTDSLAAGVLVQLFADDTETAVATTRTNPVGHYGFHASRVDDGTYRLLIGDTWVGGGTWQDATSIAVSSSEGTTVDQQLTRAGSISGTIVDSDGNGVADAVVVATASDGTIVATTVTDASGAFTLGVPSDGTYTVSFNAGDDPVDVGGPESDEFVIDAANLDPNVDYDVFIWVAHGNPTTDTVLVSTPIELTRAQKDALFG